MNYFSLILSCLSIISFSCESQTGSGGRSENLSIDPATVDTATFAGGCFWCVEAVFDRVQGVKRAVSGYSGGIKEDANYDDVSNGRTDHAETVEIYYDPEVISYAELLEIFFATHDATQVNRQGPDIGRQYRTAIFYHTAEQKELSEKYISQLQESSKYTKPIVTEINNYDSFYIAEEYHQDYYDHNPDNPYIISVTKPKIRKFEKQFRERLKPQYR
jgi:peptide-methionine (S)-S-oxide reductase